MIALDISHDWISEALISQKSLFIKAIFRVESIQKPSNFSPHLAIKGHSPNPNRKLLPLLDDIFI